MSGSSQKNLNDSRIKNLIHIDPKSYPLNPSDSTKISSLVEQQLEYLLNKRQRQQEKKHRLLILQQTYQKERVDKLKKITQKIARSEEVKEENLKQKNAKNKRNLEHFENMKKKISTNNEEDLEKHLEKRKQFETEKTKTHAGGITAAHSSIQPNPKHNPRRAYSHVAGKTDVQHEIHRIRQRIDRATINQHMFQQQIVSKIREKSLNFSSIMEKARVQSSIHQLDTYSQYYDKANHIIECQNKVKNEQQKQAERKRKALEEKMKKCHENLERIEGQRDQKLQQLVAKMDKSPISPKYSNKSSKTSKHLHQFQLNSLRLQQQKSQRAQQILKKHLQLSLKNKVIKQKKDKIIQAMRQVDTSPPKA